MWDGHADELLSLFFERPGFSKTDRAFITQIVFGVLRWRNRLDWMIAQVSNRPLTKIAPWILNILRLGVYQLLFLDRVPESAAVNESVKLAHRYGHRGTVGFVNGLLREVNRKREAIEYPDKEKEPAIYLSVFYSHPLWLVERWLERYGWDKTEKICESNNEIPPLTVRTNTLKITVEELKDELEKRQVCFEPCVYAREGLRLRSNIDLFSFEPFQKGLFQVQDEASILVSGLVSPWRGSLVLDICAAPGGKATHLAQMMDDEGNILAGDLHWKRMDKIKENCERLGITSVKMFCADASKTLPLKEEFEAVLLDAPCSGLGVLRRNPDARWHKKGSDLDMLARMQYKILENTSVVLKRGGVLVYCTCSNEPEETGMVIGKFLQRNKHFHLESPEPFLPKGAQELIRDEGYFETMPSQNEMDGFFGVRLRKT
jgi:16S rRNA (cytosine967-C5)-methyltransferase